jgi:acyl carrier protein
MRNPYSTTQIRTIVHGSLAQALFRPDGDITADATLVGDLGMDSLAFVAFRYELEERLGVTLPTERPLDLLAEVVGDPRLVQNDGELTELAAAALQGSAFHYSAAQVRTGMGIYDVAAATTVDNWVHFCHGLFNHLPRTCPNCGHGEARVTEKGRAVCDECESFLFPRDGDTAFFIELPTILRSLQVPA